MRKLQKAAKELNEKLGLDPAIKTLGKGVTKEKLTEQLLETKELIQDEDDVSEETIALLEELEGSPSPKEEDDEQDDEQDDVWDDDDAVEEEEKPKGEVKKTPKKKEPEKVLEKTKATPKIKKVSPYGRSIEILATDPDMSSKDLRAQLEEEGIDIDAGKNGITTAFSQFGKVVKLLRKNKQMK